MPVQTEVIPAMPGPTPEPLDRWQAAKLARLVEQLSPIERALIAPLAPGAQIDLAERVVARRANEVADARAGVRVDWRKTSRGVDITAEILPPVRPRGRPSKNEPPRRGTPRESWFITELRGRPGQYVVTPWAPGQDEDEVAGLHRERVRLRLRLIAGGCL